MNLLKVVETRFISNIVMVEPLKAVKDALEMMIIDLDWKPFKRYGKVVEGKTRAIKCIVSDSGISCTVS